MEPLQDLLKGLQGYDFEADDPQRTQGTKVINVLDKVIENGVDELQKRKPPLTLVIYAMKNILYPSFLPELMSEFLHLFTMVEFFRQEITEKASRLLVWDTYCKSQGDPSVSLTAEQREFCESLNLDHNQEDLRKIYLNVVSQCCIMDLTRLWLANSNTDFWIRWNEYFSILKAEQSDLLSHTFHYKMTREEISFLHGAACEVSEIMEATVRWAGDQCIRGQSIQDVFESEEFREDFPVPQLSSEFLDSINYQLDFVQDAARRIALIKGLESEDD